MLRNNGSKLARIPRKSNKISASFSWPSEFKHPKAVLLARVL